MYTQFLPMEFSKNKIPTVATAWKKPDKDDPLSKMDISIKSTYSKMFKGFIQQVDKEIQACFPEVNYSYDASPLMSKEFFSGPHEIELQNHGKEPPSEKPVMFHGVKIDPGCMIFKDAYDGKRYDKTVTITNCSNKIVTVRISEPTSKAFKMKPMPIGQMLSPGLSIIRHIKYLYTKPTAIPQACMDICIDNDYFDYDLIVNTCYPQIKVHPKTLDFGEVDVNLVSDIKNLTIMNTGTKTAQYSIDLGRNVLQIVVEPIRGTIQPGESKIITVELFGTKEGPFAQEFWIKTDPLQRVHIQGYFIEPLLKVDYPLSDNHLLILNFPKTFVGVPQQRSVVIQNHSSTSASFCINGRIKDQKYPYNEAKAKDKNFGMFFLWPLEGRLCKDQKCIFTIVFIPEKKPIGPNYYICNAVVDVRKCRLHSDPYVSKSQNPDIQNMPAPVPLLDYISVSTYREEQAISHQELMVYNDMITIILYGEMEEPDITIEPNKLCLQMLKIYENHEEILQVTNHSKNWPLVLKYNKIACIEFEPATISLPPNETVEITLKLRPTKMGKVSAKVNFDVLFRQKDKVFKLAMKTLEVLYCGEYAEKMLLSRKTKASFLPGITPKNHNEVGYLVEDVRFNTKIEKPLGAVVDTKLLVFNKNNDALMAVPNDRQRTLRPWRNTVPCKTIFAQLPRLVTNYDIDYDLTSKEKLLKATKQSYYLNYIRSLSKKPLEYTRFEENSADYDITDTKKILMERIRKDSVTCPAIFKDKASLQSLFVPLTPYQIHKINVTPKFIQLGRLAANTECFNHFTVENHNPFHIHVSIKALYTSIKAIQEEFILKSNAQQNIDFIYHSDFGGTHHISVSIIINFFHVFDVTVLATIVANTVQCISKDITIVPTEKTAFLELNNPINSDVQFEIDTNFYNLESFPTGGVIPAGRNMVVTITFNPEVGYNPVKEIAVISESGAKELVEVKFDYKRASILLSSNVIQFKDVPLNTTVTRNLIIFNNSDQLVPLNISLEDPDLLPELQIKPMKALILQKADVVVKFSFRFQQVVNFNVPINLEFQYEFSKQIVLTGNVVYPVVSFKPELINIPKIPSGSKVHTPFRVTNQAEVETYLRFHMEEYPEFAVKTKQGLNITSDITNLAPKERKDLLLEFKPREPVAYCLYLPYSLNGILGPPELNCPETLLSSYYLNQEKNRYKSPALDVASRKLKSLKILCAAKKELLKFKSLVLDFNSFGKMKHEFQLTNVSGSQQEISMKIPSIKSYTFDSNEAPGFSMENDTVRALINPDATAKLSIEFHPEGQGDFSETVPIFVKAYSEADSFNYLKLAGTNPGPQILSNVRTLYFTPAQAGIVQSKHIVLQLIAHHCNKTLEVEFKSFEIMVTLVNIVNDEVRTNIEYLVTFAPLKDCSIETQITFSCPCLQKIIVEIFACCDSSTVINYMSEPSIIEHSTYPLFPADNDISPYALLLRTVSTINERWLYTQGYFYQTYYRVPDDMARFPVEMLNNESKRNIGKAKKKQQLLPLIKLLVNLMDSSILAYIDDGKILNEVGGNRSFANYIVYKNTILFLKSQGIFIPGLKPEHLLMFDEYLEVCEITKNNIKCKVENEFDADTFYRFSKQKWLDLFFHIYKVLVQQRIVDSKSSPQINNANESEFIKQDHNEFEKYLRQNRNRLQNWFECDAKLLLWLEYHYNRQKTILWPNQKFDEVDQRLNDFSDVDDGVALATVTAAYCPYLADQLKDIYISPKSVEQRVHNACRVVQSWKSLKLSFDVHPQTIVTANKIKIIFIVTYLYEVLPHFYPINEITIEAPLSESASYSLDIQNFGNVPIQYAATFFGEKSNLFQLDSQMLEIAGGKSRALKLTYMAKRVLEASAILVLSGEVAGKRYAKSMAIKLTGVPLTTSSNEIKLSVETYKLTNKRIPIESPYAQSYKAKIFFCFDEEAKSFEDLHSAATLRHNHVPREVDIISDECEFIEKGEAIITLSTCFLHSGTQLQFYLYFCNDLVGDFCVLIKTISTLSKNRFTPINVDASQIGKPCTCKRGLNRNCPKTLAINLPSKNELLWQSMEVMMSQCLASSTFGFIKRFSGTPMTFRLLKYYLDRYPQGFLLPSCIFNDQAEFDIVSTNKNITMAQKTIKINDVTSDETVPLLLHLDSKFKPHDVFFKLVSTNGMEVRQYQLVFPKQEIE